MFSVIQSPWTLSEAETKKGRCSVSGNGPLTFPRQLDVVADAANVARTRFAGSHISEVRGKNRKPPSTTRFLATKPQVAEAQNRDLVGRS